MSTTWDANNATCSVCRGLINPMVCVCPEGGQKAKRDGDGGGGRRQMMALKFDDFCSTCHGRIDGPMHKDWCQSNLSRRPDWKAQFLCEPLPPLPPGTYCRNCSHSGMAYYDRMVPQRRGDDVPCCPDPDCGCTAHNVETVTIEDEETKPWEQPISPPPQPIITDTNGTARFQHNAIVRYLLDAGPFDMNHLAGLPFSDQDRSQFAQLIGYSVDGYGDLPYVSDEQAEQKTAEKMERFCAVLRDGGTLMVHPDAWAEMRRSAPSACAALTMSALIGGTRVVPNRHVDPGTMYAIPKRGVEIAPEFKCGMTREGR